MFVIRNVWENARARSAGQAARLPLLPSLNILFNSCLETSHRGDLNALMFGFYLL